MNEEMNKYEVMEDVVDTGISVIEGSSDKGGLVPLLVKIGGGLALGAAAVVAINKIPKVKAWREKRAANMLKKSKDYLVCRVDADGNKIFDESEDVKEA